VHITPPPSHVNDVIRRTGGARHEGRRDADGHTAIHPALILIADGAPPPASVEHAVGDPDRFSRRLHLRDWRLLLDDDFDPAFEEAVIVIAVLTTCGTMDPWRWRPRFAAVMRRAILVAPLPPDAGAAVVGACGLGDFVPLDRIETALRPAVDALARRIREGRATASDLQDDATPPKRFQ
jgi:hypothetical protein